MQKEKEERELAMQPAEEKDEEVSKLSGKGRVFRVVGSGAPQMPGGMGMRTPSNASELSRATPKLTS